MPFYGPDTNALLDGSNHTDTVAQTVSRGSIVYGDSTPNWNELTIGGAGKGLISDGTDIAYVSTMSLLATATASNDATIDFTLTGWTNSDYIAYRVVLSHIVPASDAVTFRLRTSTDGGSTFDAGASDYEHSVSIFQSSVNSTASSNSSSFIGLTHGSNVGTGANEDWSGEVLTINPSEADHCRVFFNGWYRSAAAVRIHTIGSGARVAAADVDAIRFLMSSGNIQSGTFKLYGIAA